MLVKFKYGALFFVFLLFSVSPACALSQVDFTVNTSSDMQGTDISMNSSGSVDSDSGSLYPSVGGDGGFQGELDGYNQTPQPFSSSNSGIDTLENMDYNSTWGNIQGNSGIDTINDKLPNNPVILDNIIKNYAIIPDTILTIIRAIDHIPVSNVGGIVSEGIPLKNMIIENIDGPRVLSGLAYSPKKPSLVIPMDSVNFELYPLDVVSIVVVVVEVGFEVYCVVDDMVHFYKNRQVETMHHFHYEGMQVN